MVPILTVLQTPCVTWTSHFTSGSRAFLHEDVHHPFRNTTTSLLWGQFYPITFQNDRITNSKWNFEGETNVCPAPAVRWTLWGLILCIKAVILRYHPQLGGKRPHPH